MMPENKVLPRPGAPSGSYFDLKRRAYLWGNRSTNGMNRKQCTVTVTDQRTLNDPMLVVSLLREAIMMSQILTTGNSSSQLPRILSIGAVAKSLGGHLRDLPGLPDFNHRPLSIPYDKMSLDFSSTHFC
jgi:hypothetical protein